MKNVFILGAGASVSAGGPLMVNFLEHADLLRRNQERGVDEGIGDALEAFNDVFTAKRDLRGVYDKSQLELDNIEILFGAIEMGGLIRKFPHRDEEGIVRLRESIVKVIYRTLESKMHFEVRNGEIHPDRAYHAFARLINRVKETDSRADYSWCSVITFNYDIALEQALRAERVPFDYNLDESEPQGAMHVLKLHGSINWGYVKIAMS